MDCLFCKIATGKIIANQVGESAGSLAFLDIVPRAKGHTLIVPKEHAETILDLPDEQLSDLFKLVQAVTARLKNKLGCDGFSIGINMSKAAGQAVEHLHVHAIPRWSNDGGGNMHTIINRPPTESVAEVLQLVNS